MSNDKSIKSEPRGYSEEFIAQKNGVVLASVLWKDTKTVTLCSSFVGRTPIKSARRYDRKKREYVDIDQPEIVRVYNKHMGGVDEIDANLGRLKTGLKSKKWYCQVWRAK